MPTTPEFVRLMSNAADEFINYLKAAQPEKPVGYILLAFEDGDVEKMMSCSNLGPELMYRVLTMLVHHTKYHDVTDETEIH